MNIWFWLWVKEQDITSKQALFLLGLFVFGFCLEYFYGIDNLEDDIERYFKDLFRK